MFYGNISLCDVFQCTAHVAHYRTTNISACAILHYHYALRAWCAVAVHRLRSLAGHYSPFKSFLGKRPAVPLDSPTQVSVTQLSASDRRCEECEENVYWGKISRVEHR